ncbi:phosphate/phosphite/phosphonate ABC transporter substrate-binding protein [Pseudothauera rhizosphaerae]|uniref:Phosphate/phosphite/phosphonate ABC transporter substrate-binding protein n=1 Tax=Pseudothauera rhizosphaerae TaxID=2565932 RepID=A0A4S4ASE9_9RHOO|nr:phosphate/phosphite/phosphonate ABC transporter substrate-binding protein [Pseudothauera rhizosphaerae]THF62755.1 phosphate/phosphite/phosphonate ABC transporter substrate-binding protein [Pseudothauera rhizosphaerae]
MACETTRTLRCGLLPGESRTVVERMHAPVRAYLERRLGMRISFVVGRSYVATGEALRRGELDLAYLGPVTYVLQSRAAALEPCVRPCHAGAAGPTFRAALIVPAGSTAETIADLRGVEIALGDLVSTSASWVPRHMLLEAGLTQDRDYVRRHLGTHDAVAEAVARRSAEAGALSLTVLERLLAEGRIEAGAIRVLAVSAPIPEYMWTFRAGLPEALRDAVREAFVDLRDPEALAVYRAVSFIPAVDADVDRMRGWMEAILQARLRPAAGGTAALVKPDSAAPILPYAHNVRALAAGRRPLEC